MFTKILPILFLILICPEIVYAKDFKCIELNELSSKADNGEPKEALAGISTEEYKLIETIEKDTTGSGFTDKIKILADEKNSGYIVEIVQHKGRTYRLKPTRGNFIAPYASHMPLSYLIADVNNDKIPEIVISGRLSHENDIYIFQWKRREYRVIFHGFYSGFWFKDITGDNAPELVIEDRMYGLGYERLYFQWQKDRYKKIYYEIDATGGVDRIKDLLSILSIPDQNYDAFEHPDYLRGIFTREWLAEKENIEYAGKLREKILSIQLLQYIDGGIKRNNKISDVPVEYTWRFKVLVYSIEGSKVLRKVKILEASTKLTDVESRQYMIDYFKLE